MMTCFSTVKLQKAKSRAEQTNPYSNYMYQTVTSMLARSGGIDHPYLKKVTSRNQLDQIGIVSTGKSTVGCDHNDRFLCGSTFSKDDVEIYAIGGKGREVLERRG